jgi:hypothetical protein
MRKMGVHIEYHIEAADHILVGVGSNDPQRIEVEDTGLRRYFLCPCCEGRSYKLYLPPNGKQFKCQKCHKLRHYLTTINKHTPHGKMLYQMNRMNKLIKMRESMGTILYKGEFTKKFKSFLKQCGRIGYTQAIDDAAGLMTALRAFSVPLTVLDKGQGS